MFFTTHPPCHWVGLPSSRINILVVLAGSILSWAALVLCSMPRHPWVRPQSMIWHVWGTLASPSCFGEAPTYPNLPLAAASSALPIDMRTLLLVEWFAERHYTIAKVA